MRKAKTVAKLGFLAPEVITKVIPAPTDGWDAISPLAEMDPKRAPILINWVPRPGYVELRGGYVPYNDTLSNLPVETLMVRRSPTGEQMFAASGSKIYDVSISDGSDPPVVVSGLGSARWQYVNFTPGGGTTVIQLVNGVDQLRQYNGTAWTTPAITGLPGGSTANIININSQKHRLWYIMKDSSVAAFMPTDAITGAIAGTLDLGATWQLGGHLVAMSAWTLDGGFGPSDYAMFISSRGQVTLYSGVDPTDASDWKIVGTFNVAPPIGYRCLYRTGSDVQIITQMGVIPISQALPFDPSADRSVAITARIQNAMAAAALSASNNFGWQLISFPFQQLIILNVPYSENSNQQQFVMNALTGAWCQFVGWESNCYEIYNNNLYWGGNDGRVSRGYAGSADFFSPINADMQCAYNWLDEPGRVKRMTMVQPLLVLGGILIPTIGVDVDFLTSNDVAPVTTTLMGTVLWDFARWDISLWPAEITNFTSWLSVDAIGHAMAVRMRVNISPYGNNVGAEFDFANFDESVFAGDLSTTLPVLQVNAFNAIAETGGAI